jgi:hypothetical protein
MLFGGSPVSEKNPSRQFVNRGNPLLALGISLFPLTSWLLEAIVTVEKQPVRVAGERR